MGCSVLTRSWYDLLLNCDKTQQATDTTKKDRFSLHRSTNFYANIPGRNDLTCLCFWSWVKFPLYQTDKLICSGPASPSLISPKSQLYCLWIYHLKNKTLKNIKLDIFTFHYLKSNLLPLMCAIKKVGFPHFWSVLLHVSKHTRSYPQSTHAYIDWCGERKDNIPKPTV